MMTRCKSQEDNMIYSVITFMQASNLKSATGAMFQTFVTSLQTILTQKALKAMKLDDFSAARRI